MGLSDQVLYRASDPCSMRSNTVYYAYILYVDYYSASTKAMGHVVMCHVFALGLGTCFFFFTYTL